MSMSYEQLEKGVRAWGLPPSTDTYDPVGVIHLLAACLDNLRENALDVDLEELPDCLDEAQQKFLRKIAGYLS